MSYILDALKKSEEERHQGQVPSLGGNSTLIHSSGNKSIIWPWVIAVLLLLNMLFIVYWLIGSDMGDRASENFIEESPVIVHQQNNMRDEPDMARNLNARELELAPEPEPEPEPELISPSIASIEPPDQRQNNSVHEEPMLITPKSGARAYSGPAYDNVNEEIVIEEPDVSFVKHASDFPQSFQRRIPDMSFNSHIYTDIPGSRRVMINNNYLRQGQFFSGLTVVQITEEGVVLSLDGQAFKVGVLRDWNSPR